MSRETGTELLVSSRRVVLQENDTNLYWRAARAAKLDTILSALLAGTGAESVVLFGEVIGHGVQDLTYGHEVGAIGFRYFDLMLDREYVSEGRANELLDHVDPEYRVERVPLLWRGPFSPTVLAAITEGSDFTGSHIREGVVVKPVEERRDAALGRVILKSISDAYLTRSGGTEYH